MLADSVSIAPTTSAKAASSLPLVVRTWIVSRYGGPQGLQLVERPVPTLGPRDLLIRVEATTVNSGDRRIRAFDLPRGMGLIGRLALGVTGPRQPVLGTELTGIVVAIGANVTRFRVGDPVIAFTGLRMGAHADHVRVAETSLIAHRPDNMSTDTAAALAFGGTTALDFLRRAGLEAGESVLVIGAAGTVGSAFVQLASLQGGRVTAVASRAQADCVQRLGASTVIDRTREPLDRIKARFDIIADTVGALTFARARPLLARKGRYLAIAGDLGDLLALPRDGKRSIAGPAAERADDFAHLVALAADRAFIPLIDSHFPFEDLPAAHARADTGHKHGSVVVRIDTAT